MSEYITIDIPISDLVPGLSQKLDILFNELGLQMPDLVTLGFVVFDTEDSSWFRDGLSEKDALELVAERNRENSKFGDRYQMVNSTTYNQATVDLYNRTRAQVWLEEKLNDDLDESGKRFLLALGHYVLMQFPGEG